MVRRPPHRYLPYRTKIILVVSPQNVSWAEALFCGYGLEIMKGSRYLGGFVGTEAVQYRWIEEKMEGWKYLVDIMPRVARKQP